MSDILLIDDNDDFRELFILSLQQAGIKREIFVASNPLDGLAIYNKYRQKIQIVICDYYMPVANGGELLDMIKSQDSSVYFCILTGDDSVARKKFTGVDKCFLKDNLQDVITFIKSINYKRE